MKKFTTFLIFFLSVAVGFAQPKLSSYSSARATIFLDFDGQFVDGTAWNYGGSFYCQPAGLNDAQITEIFNRVSEDFRPFNINITTDSAVYLSAPLTQRMRIIITPTSDWYKNVGGVSFTRSFTWGDGTPAFVFPDRLTWSPKIIAECVTHESGHTLGLSHQASYNENCSLVTTYNEGKGMGQTSWAPVMGNSYYRNISGWNNGPTPSGCTADQDNLSIITGINGFTYREDDHSDDPQNNPTKILLNKNQIAAEGIITTNRDRDAFELNVTEQSNFKLNAKPFAVGLNNEGANLDVQVTLLNAQYQTIRVYNPATQLDVSIDTVLTAGKYYLVVEGSGNANFSNYGSLGSYAISGELSSMFVMPVSLVELSGNAQNGKHRLSWSIICDEKLQSQVIEASTNGKDFDAIATVNGDPHSFEYSPFENADLFYRIKVTTASGSFKYSNIIVIKQGSSKKEIVVTPVVRNNQLKISSTKSFAYLLTDMSGKVLRKGNESAGYSVISLSNSPNGIYVIQIISNSQRIIERIVKL